MSFSSYTHCYKGNCIVIHVFSLLSLDAKEEKGDPTFSASLVMNRLSKTRSSFKIPLLNHTGSCLPVQISGKLRKIIILEEKHFPYFSPEHKLGQDCAVGFKEEVFGHWLRPSQNYAVIFDCSKALRRTYKALYRSFNESTTATFQF